MPRTLRVCVVSPADELVVEEVRHVRLDADDGARGVMPGHERATMVIERGLITVRVGEVERYLVSEGGVAFVSPDEVHIVTSWAAQAETMQALVELVRHRAAGARALDERRHTVAHRHEVAVRRALHELLREVS